MQSPSENKDKLIFLLALSLFLAAVENVIPRPLPFFRLGLSNAALLLGLTLSIKDYALLTLGKWLLSSLIAGTLLSPFAILSLASNLSSAVVMLLFCKIAGKLLSRYSISLLGGAASAFTQVAVSTLILSSSVMALLPYMLLFSEIAALAVAFLSYHIEIPEELPSLEGKRSAYDKPLFFLYASALLLLCLSRGLWYLTLLFILSITLCLILKRRVIIHIYLITLLSVVIFNLFTPSGKVIYGFVTEGALLDGVEKGLKLITLVAFSQSFAELHLIPSRTAGKVFILFSSFMDSLSGSEGKLLYRIKSALELKKVKIEEKEKQYTIDKRVYAVLVLIIAVASLSLFS